jgi:hypothetical protein
MTDHCAMHVPYFSRQSCLPDTARLSSDLRESARWPFQESGKLLDQDALPADVTIIDISIGGMGVLVGEARREGEPCAISFDVPFQHARKRLNAWGKVTYCQPLNPACFKVGVRFRGFDMDSKIYIEELCGFESL